MSVEREMSLVEWCAKLPSQHLVNQELAELTKQLAALAEQNAKMRKALTKWRYLDSSYNWRCGHCGNEVEDGHKEGCALYLPNLATPALNRIKAEAYLEAAELVEAHHTWTTNVAAGKLLRTKADELEGKKGKS